jgi:hypothetical protein
MTRTANCLCKERMNEALHNRERDRVPVCDWFCGELPQTLEGRTGAPSGYDIYPYSKMTPFVKGPEEK